MYSSNVSIATFSLSKPSSVQYPNLQLSKFSEMGFGNVLQNYRKSGGFKHVLLYPPHCFPIELREVTEGPVDRDHMHGKWIRINLINGNF